MKMKRFEVSIKVAAEGYQEQTARVAVIMPEGVTNVTEILRAIENIVTREVERVVEKKGAGR